jgi:hypothetical protein
MQLILHYGETQIIGNISLGQLGMDEAYLIVNNKNYSGPISVMYNVVACEHCAFELLTDALEINSSRTLTINTQYPYDFQVFVETMNRTALCQINSYHFSEHGSYYFDIIQTNQDESSCTINLTNKSSYYFVPVICAVLFLCCLVLIIQLCQRFYNSRYIGRILTNIGHERLVNNEADSTSAISSIVNRRDPSLIANEHHQDEIIDAGISNNESSLIGSNRGSNNSIKITKVLPKRLQGLDTFRGFALMVMIFVNYGGKNLFLFYSFFEIFISSKGGGYWFFDHSGKPFFFSINILSPAD